MSLARWVGRAKRVRAFAADLVGIGRDPKRRHPDRIGLLCFLDLVQDADLILPVAEAARDNPAFEVRVAMTEWLDRVAPEIRARVEIAGFSPLCSSRDAVLAGLAPDVAKFDALLTASDTTALPHRYTHALARRARAMGRATFTMQHGLENVGLTYRGDGEHDFASEWILTWGPPEALPAWVRDDVRRRCIAVGRPLVRRTDGAVSGTSMATIAVFENLHWERYDESYRRAFVSDLLATAQSMPDHQFVVRPHPAGQFLARNADILTGAPANLILAHSADARWGAMSSADLVALAAAAITTPSTIALDAALADTPVAVAGYGLDLPAYAPLPILGSADDWRRFLQTPSAAPLAAFRARHVMEGDACARILQAIADHARPAPPRLGLLDRAEARIEQALAPDQIPARRYQHWLAAYQTLDAEDRAAIERESSAWRDERVTVIIDARNGGDRARTEASVNRQIGAAHDVLVVGPGERLPAALSNAGRYACLIEAGDEIDEHALFVLSAALRERPKALFVYSDEDRIGADGRRREPYFKPDWDADLFADSDYACRLTLFDADAAREIACGTLHDLLRQMARQAPQRPVLHAPFPLYHRAPGRTAFSRFAPTPTDMPLVSAIIPTRDRVDLLSRCVDGLLRDTDYPAIEVVIVDNGSREEETRRYLQDVVEDERVRVLTDPAPFNFSRLNNRGVAAARGDIIALVNNDVEITSPHWLREMAALAARPDVGAVGAKLIYPNGRIQHAGCVLGMGGVAAHIYNGRSGDAAGHGGQLHHMHQVSAVTGACLVTRRAVWDALGGLDEALPVAYNDIDFCLRVRGANLRVLWTPFAELIHHESATRGADRDAEARARLERDKALMQQRWGEALQRDPFFNPNLALDGADIRLAYPPRVRKAWVRPSQP